MYALIGALTLFLILVTFHEYGHYSVARYFKIKIIKFSIGFGLIYISGKIKIMLNSHFLRYLSVVMLPFMIQLTKKITIS